MATLAKHLIPLSLWPRGNLSPYWTTMITFLHALARVIDCINDHPKTDIIYTDEDKIDESGNRSQPHFKSDWNPDLLIGQNYISHLGIYRRSALQEIGAFASASKGSGLGPCTPTLNANSSCPHQAYTRSSLSLAIISGSTARDIDEKSYAHEAARKALEDYFKTRNIDASLEAVDRFYWSRFTNIRRQEWPL